VPENSLARRSVWGGWKEKKKNLLSLWSRNGKKVKKVCLQQCTEHVSSHTHTHCRMMKTLLEISLDLFVFLCVYESSVGVDVEFDWIEVVGLIVKVLNVEGGKEEEFDCGRMWLCFEN
jgi:hypothetical protein